MKVCVIDIGTNSVHALFAEIHATGAFHVIGKEKEMVRLGDGAMVTGLLAEDTMQTTLAVLQRFLHLAKHRKMARVIATATSAIRESRNGGAFLDRIRSVTGLKVHIITGEEEGRLIALAVQNTIHFSKHKALIMDIGGGSTEFVAATQKQNLWIESLHLGSNRLSQLFPLSNPPKKMEVKKLERYVLKTLKPVFKKLKKNPIGTLIGTSGTIINFYKTARQIGKSSKDNTKVGAVVSRKMVETTYQKLTACKMSDLSKIKTIDPQRRDMIVGGATILATLFKHSNLKGLTVCDKALREGILYDFIEKNRGALKIEADTKSLRRRSILTLAALAPAQKSHAEHTAKLALQFFDALQKKKMIPKTHRDLLEYAALLHDVGYHISFNRHHRHTYYLITNTELHGFSAAEIQTMAWVARLHRRSLPKKEDAFIKFPPAQQKLILQLAAILRLADAFDHSHFGLVKKLSCKFSVNTVVITAHTQQDAQWEVYEASERRSLFEDIFGKKLELKIKQMSS